MRKLISVSLLFVVVALPAFALSGCASADAATPGDPAPSEHDGNPFRLLGSMIVARKVQANQRFTAQQKLDARNGLYEAAFGYARVGEGLTRVAARKYAAAIADNMPTPTLTCADFVTPPPDCQTTGASSASTR